MYRKEKHAIDVIFVVYLDHLIIIMGTVDIMQGTTQETFV